MFLDTVSEPCVRVLLEPQSGIVYGMIKGEPETLLSQANLELYSQRLFPCFGHGVVAPVHTRIQEHVDAARIDENEVVAQDVAVVPSEYEQQCSVCMEPFSDEFPQVCLPCGVQVEDTFRHCVVCRRCLDTMMRRAVIMKCPICRKTYDVDQLKLALQYGCLEYPINRSHEPRVHTLRGWPEQSEAKKRCLQQLRARRPVPHENVWERSLIPLTPQLSATMIVTPSDYFETIVAIMDQHQTGYICASKYTLNT